MKIVEKDNLDREIPGTSDEVVVAENITNEAYAGVMVDALRAKFCDYVPKAYEAYEAYEA